MRRRRGDHERQGRRSLRIRAGQSYSDGSILASNQGLRIGGRAVIEAGDIDGVAPGTIPRRRAALVVTAAVISLGLQVFWVSHALVITPFAGKPWLP